MDKELKGGKHSHQLWLDNEQERLYQSFKGLGFKFIFLRGLKAVEKDRSSGIGSGEKS